MKLSEALDYWVEAWRSAFVDLSIAALGKDPLLSLFMGEKEKSKRLPHKKPNQNPKKPKKQTNHHPSFYKFCKSFVLET